MIKHTLRETDCGVSPHRDAFNISVLTADTLWVMSSSVAQYFSYHSSCSSPSARPATGADADSWSAFWRKWTLRQRVTIAECLLSHGWKNCKKDRSELVHSEATGISLVTYWNLVHLFLKLLRQNRRQLQDQFGGLVKIHHLTEGSNLLLRIIIRFA